MRFSVVGWSSSMNLRGGDRSPKAWKIMDYSFSYPWVSEGCLHLLLTNRSPLADWGRAICGRTERPSGQPAPPSSGLSWRCPTVWCPNASPSGLVARTGRWRNYPGKVENWWIVWEVERWRLRLLRMSARTRACFRWTDLSRHRLDPTGNSELSNWDKASKSGEFTLLSMAK